MIAGVTLLSGLYPSVVLSGFKPVSALKNQVVTGRSHGWSFRRVIIFFQFFGSQMLVLLTLIILNQINYLSNKPAGFESDAILLLNLPEDNQRKAFLLRDELKNVPGVAHVSLSSAFPFGPPENINLAVNDSLPDAQVAGFYIDEQYIGTFGLKIIAGSSFYSTTPVGEVIA
jgi:hypothetical protein